MNTDNNKIILNNITLEFEKICDEVLNSDPKIRFSGVLNSRGDLVIQKSKGDSPLLSIDEVKMSIHYTYERWNRLKNLEHRLGKERTSLTEHDNVILVSVLLKDDLLLFSTEPGVDYYKIISKVRTIVDNNID